MHTRIGKINCVSFEQAYDIQTEAETLLTGFEYEIPSLDVLRLVENSACSAYDCEFVVLAKRLDTKLVTADKQLLKQFPGTAISLTQSLR